MYVEEKYDVIALYYCSIILAGRCVIYVATTGAAVENLTQEQSFAVIFSGAGPTQNIIITAPAMTPNHKRHKKTT